MDQSKTRSYLLYAFGEVFLVVIGILIALQVNNWNEERKLLTTEREILTDIRSNLEANRLDLANGLDFNQFTIDSYMVILEAIEQDLPMSAAIDSSFDLISTWHSPYFTYTAYETLKAKGLDVLRNQKLKESISAMFENVMVNLVQDYDQSEWHFNDIKRQFITQHITYRINGKDVKSAYPVDYEALKKDQSFYNMLTALIRLRTMSTNAYEGTIKEIDLLIDEIDEYLEDRGE